MKTFIVILLLVACVLSYKDRHELPYGGAILRRNGELIPGAIACIWTKLFEDLCDDYVDPRGVSVVQTMIKYLKAIDLALQTNSIDDLLPLLKKYQAYLKSLLLYIRDRDIHAAVCEIINGNVKVEQDFTKAGLDMNALNVYVKHSAVRLNTILITNKRN